MTTTLRDALAAARINRLKTRMARAWVPSGLAGLLRVLGGADEDEATPPPAPSSLN